MAARRRTPNDGGEGGAPAMAPVRSPLGANAEPPGAKDVEPTTTARVRYCAGLMAEDLWPMFPHAEAFRCRLGKVWGVAESTVKNYSAEAHRMLKLDPEEIAQLKLSLASRFRAIAEHALDNVSKISGLPDYRSAHDAYKTYGQFAGIEFDQKVTLGGAVKLEDLDALRGAVLGGASPSDTPMSLDDLRHDVDTKDK